MNKQAKNQPHAKVEKAKDMKGVLTRLSKYMLQYRGLIIACITLTLVSNILNLMGPYLSGKAVDAIAGIDGVDFSQVFYYGGLMLIIFLVSAILSYFLALLLLRFSQHIIRQMREEVFKKITSLPTGYFDSHQAGDIISRISYDIDTINVSLSNDVLQVITSMITIVGSLIMMLSLSTRLVIIFVFTVPISIFFVRLIAKKIKPLFSGRSKKLGELNGFVEEIIVGQKTIKAYHQEEMMQSRFEKVNKEAVDAYYASDYMSTVIPSTVNFMNNLSLTLVSGFGAYLFLQQAITVGALSSFVLYSRRFSGPINEMANIFSEIQSAIAAAERVFRFLDEKEEVVDVEDAKYLQRAHGEVAFNHVKFGYLANQTIIHDLCLHIPKGSTIAIVGPTGAGKSTIINLLMRFYDPQKGSITLDGETLPSLCMESVRKNYAMVLQDTWLFQGSIYDNITYGNSEASMEDVVRCAKAANIHDTILRLPNGYDSMINDEGVNISAGQKQMLTIARAMLLDCSMLILDEATSNVDTQTELKIQEAMQTLMEGKTCFVIAHRLSTIQNADTILVVQKGEVVEQGNHNTLMQQKGLYANLYNSQFE